MFNLCIFPRGYTDLPILVGRAPENHCLEEFIVQPDKDRAGAHSLRCVVLYPPIINLLEPLCPDMDINLDWYLIL